MENYEVLDSIGKGNFGSISKILRKSDDKILVWKELDYGRMTEKEKQNIVSEVNILRDLHHPNIVKYYDRIIDKKNTKIYIIMEYCEGGDIGMLIKRLKKTKEHIPEEVIWKIFTQLLLALFECHNHKEGKILHRDIKPSNVFLDGENNIKLGDFGLSRMLSNESYFAYSHVGTPYYMSPEQIEEVKYNDKSDIWSLGCFLYEVATFNPPFEATNQLSLALKIKSGKVDPIPNKYSKELSQLIMWMLTVDQSRRPNVDDLINCPPVMVRIKERKLKEHYVKIKKMEEILRTKEKEIEGKEGEFKKKEDALLEKEKSLKEAEEKIREKEREMIFQSEDVKKKLEDFERKQKEITEREEGLNQREKEFNEQKGKYERQIKDLEEEIEEYKLQIVQLEKAKILNAQQQILDTINANSNAMMTNTSNIMNTINANSSTLNTMSSNSNMMNTIAKNSGSVNTNSKIMNTINYSTSALNQLNTNSPSVNVMNSNQSNIGNQQPLATPTPTPTPKPTPAPTPINPLMKYQKDFENYDISEVKPKSSVINNSSTASSITVPPNIITSNLTSTPSNTKITLNKNITTNTNIISNINPVNNSNTISREEKQTSSSKDLKDLSSYLQVQQGHTTVQSNPSLIGGSNLYMNSLGFTGAQKQTKTQSTTPKHGKLIQTTSKRSQSPIYRNIPPNYSATNFSSMYNKQNNFTHQEIMPPNYYPAQNLQNKANYYSKPTQISKITTHINQPPSSNSVKSVIQKSVTVRKAVKYPSK